ncbi:hypothetical protein H0H87_012365, partial [Tephrocybe sp. NHM501043]
MGYQWSGSINYNWTNFLAAFHKKFANPSLILNADTKLDNLKQTGSAHYYLTAFIELVSHLDMTEETKISCFMKGLKSTVKNHLVNIINQPKTLKEWEPLIISIDTNLHQHEVEHYLENGGKKRKDTNSMDTFPSSTFIPSYSA